MSKLKLNNSNKNYDIDEVTMNKEIELIDKIIKLCPEIKTKRKLILTHILTPKKITDNQYVLEQIIINGNKYYKDRYKCILNSNIQLVGIWQYENETFKYYIFAEHFKDGFKKNVYTLE